MMQSKFALFPALLALALILSSCGGSSNAASNGSSTSLTGNWQMSLQNTNDTKLNPVPQSGFLLQTGDAVSGSVIYSDNPCSGVGAVQGSVTGANVSLQVNVTGVEISLTGATGTPPTTSSCTNSYMSGTYTTLSTGCSGTLNVPSVGTWTACQVTPLNGNFTGTFTSNNTKQSPYAVTGQLSQGSNSGTSSSPLTGTITVTGYCFASANLTGVVSGTGAVLSMVNPAGAEIGQMNLSSAMNGTALTGTYNILPTPVSPCGDGAGGSVTLTLAGSTS